jgi:hypothetical protein
MLPEETREWEMVVELMDLLDDMNDNQAEFIRKLYDNLDPFEPFLEQMEGLAEGKNQEKWLFSLYEIYCNQDRDAAEDIWDD